MYRIIKVLSSFVRIFLLPNPFGSLEYGFLVNLLAEPILHIITFWVVGLFYNTGSVPAFGSFLYLLFYVIHIGLLMLWSYFNLNVIVLVLVVVVYLTVLYFIRMKIFNRFRAW